MNCPYCSRRIHGFTGLQEAQKFQRHLRSCRKNPARLPITDGKRTILSPVSPTISDALRIRADSGQ